MLTVELLEELPVPAPPALPPALPVVLLDDEDDELLVALDPADWTAVALEDHTSL